MPLFYLLNKLLNYQKYKIIMAYKNIVIIKRKINVKFRDKFEKDKIDFLKAFSWRKFIISFRLRPVFNLY